MNTNSSFFVYALPKSNSLGHYVKDKDIAHGLKKVVDAFEKNFEGYQSGNIQLEIFYKKDNEQELVLAQQTISKMNIFLGLPVHTWENSGYEYLKSAIRWESSSKSIFDVLDYLAVHKKELLPLFHFTVLQFYHYGTKITENAQITYIVDSCKLFIDLYMILPYTENEEKVYQIITRLYKELPFKLNPKNFRRLGPKNNRRALWKLDDETQQLLESYLI
jgi:hypothetical protein